MASPRGFEWEVNFNADHPLLVTLQFWTPEQANHEFLTEFFDAGGKR